MSDEVRGTVPTDAAIVIREDFKPDVEAAKSIIARLEARRTQRQRAEIRRLHKQVAALEERLQEHRTAIRALGQIGPPWVKQEAETFLYQLSGLRRLYTAALAFRLDPSDANREELTRWVDANTSPVKLQELLAAPPPSSKPEEPKR